MPDPKSFFRVFTEGGPLIASAVAVALLLGIAGPASAQFFNFPSCGGPPDRSSARRMRLAGRRSVRAIPAAGAGAKVIREDYSHAPPPEKRETVPERNVLVLGDAMADWLAYGLEDTYADQPDMGVVRKSKGYSGLIKYQPKGEPADWVAAAKGILATEKPEAIVVMLGLNDRISMREPAVEKSDAKSTEKKEPASNRRPSPRTRNQERSRMTPPASLAKKPSTPNYRRTMPPTTPIRRRPSRRRRARVRRTASMNFVRSAGSNSTTGKSRN